MHQIHVNLSILPVQAMREYCSSSLLKGPSDRASTSKHIFKKQIVDVKDGHGILYSSNMGVSINWGVPALGPSMKIPLFLGPYSVELHCL